jgi:hypothetical protein
LTALVLGAILMAGCPTEKEEDSNGENTNPIGTWESSDYALLAVINSDGTWDAIYNASPMHGEWTQNGNALTLFISGQPCGTAILVSGGMTVNFITEELQGEFTLTKTVSTNTKLRISNQSTVDVQNIRWQNVLIPYNITSGNTIIQSARAGGSYLFFEMVVWYNRATEWADVFSCRTQEMVTVSSGETKDFTFTNNTLVVLLSDPDNPKTLGTIANTKLQITNHSSVDLATVKWGNIEIGLVYNGSYNIKAVQAGSNYISFTINGGTRACRTQDTVTVSSGETKDFTLLIIHRLYF